METVSTASALLQAMKFDDAVYSSLLQGEDTSKQKKKSLWRIPGFGVFGAGSAVVALVAAYVARPEIGEDIKTASDILSDSGDEEKHRQVAEKAEQIGTLGAQYKEGAKEGDKPPIASVKPVVLPAPVVVPPETVQPVVVKQNTWVSKGTDLPIASITSGMELKPDVKLARPTAEIDKILRSTAVAEGVDYAELYAFAGSESSFNAKATAGSASTATGLFQFTAPTWKYLTTKVYPELGYTLEDRRDPQKSAILASRYLKSIKQELRQKIGSAPTIGQTYLGYFMGVSGASKFIQAYRSNPKAKGADLFPAAARANPQLFYDKSNRGAPLTLADTMGRLEGKVTRYYAQAAAPAYATETAPTITPIKTAPTPVSFKPQAIPQVQQVAPPEFDAVENSPKTESRDDKPSKRQRSALPASGNSTHVLANTSQTQSATYIRDKQGRLIAIRG